MLITSRADLDEIPQIMVWNAFLGWQIRKDWARPGVLNLALSVEAKLMGLHRALLDRARTNSSVGHAAERIAVMIRAAKRSAGVPHDAESGRRDSVLLSDAWNRIFAGSIRASKPP